MSDPVSSTENSAAANNSAANNSAANNSAANNSAEKDPDDWTTGDEPMTGPQQSYLSTLAQEAGVEAPPSDLSKAEASKQIDELQEQTGRGR